MTYIPPTKFPKTLRTDFPGEAPAFDAVEALRPHIGNALWFVVRENIASNQCTVCMARYLREEFGVEGFPAEALFDMILGQGKFKAEWALDEERHMKEDYEAGKALGAEMLAIQQQLGITDGGVAFDESSLINRFYPEDFKAGVMDAARLKEI